MIAKKPIRRKKSDLKSVQLVQSSAEKSATVTNPTPTDNGQKSKNGSHPNHQDLDTIFYLI